MALRMIWMRRECPFCTSIQFDGSEGTAFDRMLHLFAFGASVALSESGAVTGLRGREQLFNE